MLSVKQRQTLLPTQALGDPRRCTILLYIHGYLAGNGYEEAAKKLLKGDESYQQYQTVDNFDLEMVFREFEVYWKLRFGVVPKMIRRRAQGSIPASIHTSQSNAEKQEGSSGARLERPRLINPDVQDIAEYLLKELENPEHDSLKAFDVIFGHEPVKDSLRDCFILPMKHPDHYVDLPACAGILLYGPPGTGKSSLARALAPESSCKLVSISAAILVSKWRGDSEKNLKVVFETAKANRPCVIVFDEIESVLGKRGESVNGNPRLVSEFLAQMDSLPSFNGVCVVGTTNMPWNIDSAVLRRFERRILVDVPDQMAREGILKRELDGVVHDLSVGAIRQLSELCSEYSCSDLLAFCKRFKLEKRRRELRGSPWNCSLDDATRVLRANGATVTSAMVGRYRAW